MRTLWTNGKILTMEAEGNIVEAVLVEDGVIISTGLKNDLLPLADHVESLDGCAMYPGFVDSHIHLIGHGEKLSYIDLSTFTSIKQIKETIASHITNEKWYVSEGWNDNKLAEGRPLTCTDIDFITETAIVLKRVCRHVLVANTTAMKLAGISKETPDPIGGVIGKDENGELNGLFYDEAQQLITEHIPLHTTEHLKKVIASSIEDLKSKGITGVHTEDMAYYGPYEVPLQAYREAVQNGFRVHLLRHHEVFEQMQGEQATSFIEFGAMKIFVDGSLGGRTALLSEDYADEPGNKGMQVHSPEKLEELVKLARKYNENIAVHVIGDLAVEKILNLIEKYPVAEGKKDRLIHVNVLRSDLVERMKKLPLVLDLQPIFVASDFPWVKERLGAARLQWAYAWKSLLKKGFDCSAGSDSPVELADPLLGIDAAINNSYLPEQELTVFEAVSLYTNGSAKAIGRENNRGLILPGYDADFTILDNVLDKTNILSTSVVKTVVAGEIVYEKKK
ncbi:amidohydrolase [Psychrobacillus sp. INOP01]|uniref:amidohydrolase n=1 Tax=Psychrobacillus sp. INOP01 TaxID=2829187 RepID=UPI001BAB9DF3|nr:amidohydrolase [Psychrobacillus sp. INOP01]QUG41544.1 amidohydrolase [Psychrobacillus sp. INOP01]